MGACREGFNLRKRAGWGNAIRGIRQGRWRSVRLYVFRDTITPLLCWLSGSHEFYWQPDPVNEPEAIYCHWCHQPKPRAIGENNG